MPRTKILDDRLGKNPYPAASPQKDAVDAAVPLRQIAAMQHGAAP